jgi:rubrerythrin
MELSRMTLRTQRNLDVAMHGEAFAAAKYKRFAAFARTNENSGLANLLTEVADESRIGHFAKEVQLAGLISDDIANLQDVVRDKRYHIERYTQFAAEAEQDGDLNAARLFKGLVADDKNQLDKLERALVERQEH